MTSKEQLAEIYGTETDPLAKLDPEGMIRWDGDPFEEYIEDVIDPKNLSENTHQQYVTVYDQWKAFMEKEGRHPAFPNQDHVKGFARYLMDERGNKPGVAKAKVKKLNGAYEYWQNEGVFPHPTDANPISAAIDKIDFSGGKKKNFHPLQLDDLREILADVTNVRDRAIITLQLKLGLRAGELANIRFEDISLPDSNADLEAHYPEMGTNDRLNGHEKAIVIPSRYERDGNKSKRPRILPLDEECRRVLLRYLLVRPDNGEPWVFLSDAKHGKLNNDGVNEQVWKEVFQPEYGETEDYRGITSHFGRHFFTTYWRVEEGVDRELVKYMRGDKVANRDEEAIDAYIHTRYRHIEETYRERIFRLGV